MKEKIHVVFIGDDGKILTASTAKEPMQVDWPEAPWERSLVDSGDAGITYYRASLAEQTIDPLPPPQIYPDMTLTEDPSKPLARYSLLLAF